MIKEIRMPDLGTTVAELKIVRWLKHAGDKVARGEALLEVETDKTVTEVESYAAGFLKKIVAMEGDEVLAGDVIAHIGDEND